MHVEHVSEPEDRVIIGLAISTCPATAGADIAQAWQRFMTEGTASRVARDSADAHLYAVYCDYESDHSGRYTMVLGVAAAPTAPVPAGLRRVRIPSGPYARFVAQGEPGRAVWAVWSHVNGSWEKPGVRRYLADFERYAPDAFTPEAVTAEVLVGLSSR
jgi:predicted transcriptional regulator YdeE